MRRIAVTVAAALVLLFAGSQPSPQARAADSRDPIEDLLAEDCVDGTAMAIAQAASRLPQEGGVASDEWPPHAIGRVIPPIRSVSDLFPTFDGVAVDTENNRVTFSDENRHSMLVSARTACGSPNGLPDPGPWLLG